MAKTVRCGNFERSAANSEAWVNSGDGVLCPDCGAYTQAVVLARHRSPYMKIRAHDAPRGVTPRPYGVHEHGVVLPSQADVLTEDHEVPEPEWADRITVKVTVVHTLTLPAAEWASLSRVTGTPRQIRDHFDIHHPEAAIEKTVADGTSKVVLFHAEEA